MVAEKPPITTDIDLLNEIGSEIWKKLTIIETEAWFDTVQAIAMQHQVSAKLESRYMKSAIICNANYRRIGSIWHLDEAMPIFWDKRQWISHYESANTLTEAVGKIASTAN
ncbi:MAG: hypothetical protein AAGE84_31820 [Cyanobacteria bacterium P01_G01_bin.39]